MRASANSRTDRDASTELRSKTILASATARLFGRPFLLFVTGLGAMGLFGWRRKRRAAAFLVGLTALVAITVLAPGRASATTILSNLGQVSPNTGGLLIVGPGVTETASNNSPQSTGANPSDPFGWDPWGANDTNSHWLSVGGCCGGGGSYATFSFTSPENSFSLLWGSPNSGNTVTLYSGTNGLGTVVATVSFVEGLGYFVDGLLSPTLYGPNSTAPGDIISITTSSFFLSAVLTNEFGGFEIADVSATDPSTVPLPSTWTMMLIGLASVGFLANRRQRRLSAAPAS